MPTTPLNGLNKIVQYFLFFPTPSAHLLLVFEQADHHDFCKCCCKSHDSRYFDGLTDYTKVFHAYAYGTAFWYGLRGLCRIYDPVMVAGCMYIASFLSSLPNSSTYSTPMYKKENQKRLTNVPTGFRPPSQLALLPNDLELYNIRNDGWCLVTLAIILLSFTNAVPFSSTATPSPPPPPSASQRSAPSSPSSVAYAKAVVAATVFHHVTTGVGAYQHYKLDTHYNTSMSIGVWGNVWLTFTGLLTWGLLASGKGERSVGEAVRKVQ